MAGQTRPACANWELLTPREQAYFIQLGEEAEALRIKRDKIIQLRTSIRSRASHRKKSHAQRAALHRAD